MNRLLYIAKNKYLIAGAIFAVWMLFFDRHDLATQYDYYGQLKALEQEQHFYDSEIKDMTQKLEYLDGNVEEIERIAREKYQMKRENEDIFIIIKED